MFQPQISPRKFVSGKRKYSVLRLGEVQLRILTSQLHALSVAISRRSHWRPLLGTPLDYFCRVNPHNGLDFLFIIVSSCSNSKNNKRTNPTLPIFKQRRFRDKSSSVRRQIARLRFNYFLRKD